MIHSTRVRVDRRRDSGGALAFRTRVGLPAFLRTPSAPEGLLGRIRDAHKRSSRVGRHSLLTVILLLAAAFGDLVLSGQPKFVVALVLAWSALRMIVLSRSIADPTTLMITFATLYCAAPLIVATPYSPDTFFLPTAGAAWIYLVGTIGLFLGVAVGNALMKPIPRPATKSSALALTGLGASVLSVGLSLFFAAKFGSVGADFSYAESFAVRAQTGMGLLMLSVPLAGAAICCTLCSGQRLSFSRLVVCVLPYACLFMVHGQRKYLLFPLIFIAAAKLQVRSMRRLLVILFAASIAFYVFQFLGYSRTLNYSFKEAASERAISGFIDAQGDAMGGEAVPVFATAAAAYEGVVAPLPFAGDYLLAPTMAAPQFLIGQLFVPLNVRFSFWWNPDRAADGAGWGFSFFGEAYAVGGFALVLIMPMLMSLLFRWIYVRGFGAQTTGIMAAISLSMLPYVFWFQRNALAYFLREFGFQLLSLLVIYAVSRVLLRFVSTRRRLKRVNSLRLIPNREGARGRAFR